MKIAIIGGGAIGLLYTYYLSFQHEVTLYVRSPLQRDKIESEGITLLHNTSSEKSFVKVKLVEEWGKGSEVLSIICVKQYHLLDLLENNMVPRVHSFLFLQNGMGHLKLIDKLGLTCVLVGSVEHGALRTSESTVEHTGKGLTKIATYRGKNTELVNQLIKPFQNSFPFSVEPNYKEMLQKKLVVNAIINPITALLKVRNGTLLTNPHYFQIFKNLFSEIKGILRLDKEELYFENVVTVCRNTGANHSSMYKDLDEGRQTEIDAILGYLLEEAKKSNIDAPLVNTLYHLIKGSELGEGGE